MPTGLSRSTVLNERARILRTEHDPPADTVLSLKNGPDILNPPHGHMCSYEKVNVEDRYLIYGNNV